MRLLWEQLDIPSVAFHIAIQLPVDHRSSRIIQTKRLFDSSNKVSFQQSLKKNIVCSYLEKKRQLTIYTEKDVASKMGFFRVSLCYKQTNKDFSEPFIAETEACRTEDSVEVIDSLRNLAEPCQPYTSFESANLNFKVDWRIQYLTSNTQQC